MREDIMNNNSTVIHQTLYLARHGERCDLNDISWYQPPPVAAAAAAAPPGKANHFDHLDPQLTVRGMMQARDLGKTLSSHHQTTNGGGGGGEGQPRVYSSPFVRAVQTAHLICEELDNAANAVNTKSDTLVKVEKGLAECLNQEYMMGHTDPLSSLISTNILKGSIGSKIDTRYQTLVEPAVPETLPIMAERAQMFLSTLLSDEKDCTSPILLVTHAAVLEALSCALVPGTKFPRGIDYCSLTEIRMERQIDTGHVLNAQIIKLADYSFVRTPAEYELGTTGFRFAKRPFPPRALLGDCCAPEVDLYEDCVVALPAEVFGEEYEGGSLDDFRALSPQEKADMMNALAAGQPPPKRKMDPKRRAFVAFADSNGIIPLSKAVFLAHYMGCAPSADDVKQFASGNGMDYKAFLKFLRVAEHPEDNAADLADYFDIYDPTNSGTVSRTTFENFLTVYGDKLSSDEIEQICENFEMSSKRINYREFIRTLLNKPVQLPEIDFGDEYEDATDHRPFVEQTSKFLPPTVTGPEETTPKETSDYEEAFTSGGHRKEDKMTVEEAAERAQKLGLHLHPKDIGDYKAANNDVVEVDFEGFVELAVFVNQRHEDFSNMAGPGKTVPTHSAGSLTFSFGLKNPPSHQDMSHYSVKYGDELDYNGFLSFCEFTEQRQMAFAALAVGSPGGASQIPVDKAGVLANKFGFAPSVQDIHRYKDSGKEYMEYSEFMSFLEECRHKEDVDIDNMQEFFKPYDADGTGYVSQKVFRNLLFMFGESYENDQLDIIIRDICGNSDPINYRTFINKVLTAPSNDIAVDPLLSPLGGAQKGVLGAVQEEDETN